MNNDQTYRSFIKMHGLGNDFVIFDARDEALNLTSRQVQEIADRRHGVGCDQLIVLKPSEKAQVFMEIWNSDGSKVGACGNASRCVGDILLRESDSETAIIETDAGLLRAKQLGDQVTVNMGPARTAWQDIPLKSNDNTIAMDLTHGELTSPGAVNIGNPHAVFFVDDVDAAGLENAGLALEHHAMFPECANISVAAVSENNIRLKVWERGAGITMACGSAACAALVAANRKGLIGKSATIQLDGGSLQVRWLDDGSVQMTGPVSYSFTGEVSL